MTTRIADLGLRLDDLEHLIRSRAAPQLQPSRQPLRRVEDRQLITIFFVVLISAVRTDIKRSRDGWSNAGGRWTAELVAYALDRYHRRHLRVPTVRELRGGIDGLPSHATIRRMYGGVSRMYRVHGYRARRPGAQPGRRPTLKRDALGRFLPRADPDDSGLSQPG